MVFARGATSYGTRSLVVSCPGCGDELYVRQSVDGPASQTKAAGGHSTQTNRPSHAPQPAGNGSSSQENNPVLGYATGLQGNQMTSSSDLLLPPGNSGLQQDDVSRVDAVGTTKPQAVTHPSTSCLAINDDLNQQTSTADHKPTITIGAGLQPQRPPDSIASNPQTNTQHRNMAPRAQVEVKSTNNTLHARDLPSLLVRDSRSRSPPNARDRDDSDGHRQYRERDKHRRSSLQNVPPT